MTAVPARQAAEVRDARAAVAHLEGLWAGAVVWWGEQTGAWWALVRVWGRWRLLEAITVGEMEQALRNPAAWPWPCAKTRREHG